jgi:hypothetical protein
VISCKKDFFLAIGSCSDSSCCLIHGLVLAVRVAFGRASSPLSRVASIRRALLASSMVPSVDVAAAAVSGAVCSLTFMPELELELSSSRKGRLRFGGGGVCSPILIRAPKSDPKRAEIIENRVLPRPSNVSSLMDVSPSEFSVMVDE